MLAELPSATVYTRGYDSLRDERFAYVETPEDGRPHRLIASGEVWFDHERDVVQLGTRK